MTKGNRTICQPFLFITIILLSTFSGLYATNACSQTTNHNFTTNSVYHDYYTGTRFDSGDTEYYYFEIPGAGTLTFTDNDQDSNVQYKYDLSQCPNSYTGTTISNGNSITFTGSEDFNMRIYTNNNNETYNFTLTFTPSSSSTVSESAAICPIGADESFRDFCLRKSITVPGNMVTIGNTILVAPNTQTSTICNTYKNEAYISNAPEANNNYYLCQYWDDLSRPSTSATISNVNIPDPAHSTIEWAGLYWQAIVDDGVNVTNMNIKIKNGTDDYVTIGYDKLDWGDGVGYSGYKSYSAFKDVTDILKTHQWIDGKYTVADIPVKEGQIPSLGTYGAWTLVLIYRNDKEKLRNFSIFDGWKRLQDSYGNREVIINASGFYTPKQEPISSTVSVFAAEGDKYIAYDYLYAMNANHNDSYEPLTHTSGQTFNSSIIPENFTRIPNPINNQGIDIQSFQLGTDGENFLETKQSSINFKFTSNQDTYFPSMIAFNTELYAPLFCYDYAYKQYGQYFTEENNGSFEPYIIGNGLSTSEDIVVELFIRNNEESDTDAINMIVHITDINTSQASYIPNSTLVTLPGSVFQETPLNSNPLEDIYIGTVGGKENFQIDYSLDPHTSNINMPLKAELEYRLILSDSNNNTVPIDFKTTLNENIPLCTENNFAYYPEYSTFNVENNFLSTIQKYNLPTQTAKRAGDFKIVAYDSNAINTRKAVSTLVGVELIDANKYHDIKASCAESDSAISPRVWVMFENNSTTTDFDKVAIDTAIEKGMVSDQILHQSNPIQSAEDYYSFVRENAAFRIAYNSTDTSSDIILTPDDCQAGQIGPCYRVEGFSDLSQLDVGSGAGNCSQDIDGNPNSTDKIPQYCGNAGSKGLDSAHLAECMECIYGGNTKYVCSRDNFSIRPENFRIALYDQNQTGSNKSFIANNDTPSKSHSNANGDRIVAGYNYYVEINATNHQNDNSTPGYYVSFTEDSSAGDRSFSLKWWGFTNDHTYCNDVSDYNKSVTFFNGAADLNLSNNQIGKYDLNLIDRVWTRVDWDSNYQSHHSINSSYFMSGSDCREHSSFIPSQSSFTATYLDDMSGCDINTSDHTNSDSGIQYTDIPLYIFPYKFDLTGITPFIGPSTRTNGQTFIYMNTPSEDDKNMTYNMDGIFRAVGYNDEYLTNFVSGCYSDDVIMTLDLEYLNIPPTDSEPLLSYDLIDTNTTDIVRPRPTNIGFGEPTYRFAEGEPLAILQNKEYFTKEMNGSIRMELGYNFKRTYDQTMNPRLIQMNDFNITYAQTPANIVVNLKTDHVIFGDMILDQNVTFLYAKAKPSKFFYENIIDTSTTTPMLINIYCDLGFSICEAFGIDTVAAQTDQYNWWLSLDHNTSDYDGNITLRTDSPIEGAGSATITPKNVPIIALSKNENVIVTSDATALPMTIPVNLVRESDLSSTYTNEWLIYNANDPILTPSPFYKVRFIGTSGWAGYGDTGHVVETNASVKKHNRLEW